MTVASGEAEVPCGLDQDHEALTNSPPAADFQATVQIGIPASRHPRAMWLLHVEGGCPGASGRILNILMLADAGLLQQPLLYLSRYFIETKSDRYRLLLAVTAEGTWEESILYVLEGIRQTSRDAVGGGSAHPVVKRPMAW